LAAKKSPESKKTPAKAIHEYQRGELQSGGRATIARNQARKPAAKVAPQKGAPQKGAAKKSRSMDPAARIFIEFAGRKLVLLTDRIESCLGRLTEEQVWSRGAENENAAGNLVLHLCGNVRQWILGGVGGQPDSRDRQAEFDARGGVSLPELQRRLRSTVEEAVSVLQQAPAERLTQHVVIQHYHVTALEAIFHAVEHFSMHTGQILFLTKLLTGADLGFYRHLRTPAAHGDKTP
jgi:uncharacterized damage-inducible protein DinB